MNDTNVARRSFLARIAAGSAAFGAAFAAGGALPAIAGAEPMADELDAWFGTMKGPNKIIYDGVQPGGGPDGILYARNLMALSLEKLGTKESEFSIIVSFRHFATPYGYNDAMWAKYPQFADMLKVTDEKTKKPATRNIPLHDDVMGFAGASIPALKAKGVQFSVCGAATAFLAGVLAGKTGDAKKIEAELKANLVPGGRIVPAGVVAVQRAQRAGFAYTFAG